MLWSMQPCNNAMMIKCRGGGKVLLSHENVPSFLPVAKLLTFACLDGEVVRPHDACDGQNIADLPQVQSAVAVEL